MGRANVFRQVVMVFAFIVAIGYPVLWAALAARGENRPGLLLDALLGAIVAWFLWHARRATHDEVNPCPGCSSRLRRTRGPAGARYWTCGTCGYERRRSRPRSSDVVPG